MHGGAIGWVVEMETKVDVLEVEIACTLERQQEVSATERRATRGESRPLVMWKVWSSSKISNEVRMQGVNICFNSCEFIMQACYPKASELIGPLIP